MTQTFCRMATTLTEAPAARARTATARCGDTPERRRWSGLLLTALLLAGPAVSAAQTDEPVRLRVDEYSSQYDDYFRHYANRFFGPFVDWRWFKAQAVAESLLNAHARSEADARGVMQLLPSTFEELSSDRPDWADIHSPRSNIAAGLYYDQLLYRKWNKTFHGSDRFLLTLASYNAGYYRVMAAYRRVSRVRTWEDIRDELPGETRAYIARIRELMTPVPPASPALVASALSD